MTYHHLSVMVHRQAEKYGDKVALKYRDYETSQWIPITWNKFSQTVRQAANALVALGVEEQRNIGIFSQNKPECLFTDFAAFANRLVTIPLYATSSSAQAQYIINDAQIRFLFVGEQFQYDAAFSAFGFAILCRNLLSSTVAWCSIPAIRHPFTTMIFSHWVRGFPTMMLWKSVAPAHRMTTSRISFIHPVLPESRKA